MASRHKPKPTLTAIPIAPNSTSSYQSPRTASYNAVSLPSPLKSTLSTHKPAEEDLSHIDPDDLFIHYTIPEIKDIQSRLRADADAKQEELRVMVGERYRDLLQASTSIISIAESSRHVTKALAEMREAMTPDEYRRKPRSSSIQGKDDAHLKVLQSLSAHLKLLLDAPEHLWRLLEKNQYLQAAWLFLLARVVHRAMVTEDPEEAVWRTEGINVLAQFPLVQRQWDTVAQFRPQIAHRATQHLREIRISSEQACSTILTLHLLDSLPLTETLSALLSQRSRTLNTLLSRNLDFRTPSRPGSPIVQSRRKNFEAANMLLPPPNSTPRRTRHRKDVVRDVWDAVLELLEVIWGTMRIVRELFCANEEEGLQKSLVERSLENLQSDSPPDSTLTTSTLLSTLPSSTHLLTLPPPILSYTPYIDLASPSAHVDPSALDAKLSTWFSKATDGFEGRLQVWFTGLKSIREVWGLRRNVLEKLKGVQGLNETEKEKVQIVLDSGVRKRIGEVVNAALGDLESNLDSTIKSVVQGIRDGVEDIQSDITPSTFLFSALPIPSLLPMSLSTNSASPFKQFKEALRQRVDGRTPSLDRVLGEIEAMARDIEENLNVMNEDGQQPGGLQAKVMAQYHEAAHVSSTRICQILERIITEELSGADGEDDRVVNVVVFVGRLCYFMSSDSCTRGLCYQGDTAKAFQETLNSLHERSIDWWRGHAVSQALAECDLMFIPLSPTSASEEFEWPNQPSSQLIGGLLSLVSSLDRLGLSRPALVTKGVSKHILRAFQSAIAQRVPVENGAWRRHDVQLLWDLTFLRRLSVTSFDDSTDAQEMLDQKLSYLRQQVQSATSEDTHSNLQDHIDQSIDQYLPRSQTLLAPLLTLSTPRNHVNGIIEDATTSSKMSPTSLLPLGAPKAEHDFRPAIEIVKPSPRFGLLLVGSASMR